MKKPDLKKMRENLQLTKDALARRVGISPMTVMRCERFNRWPVNPNVARAYKQALGVA